MNKLFAVYLGGTAPRANTELHDMVFATGPRIEDTYAQLIERWFGAPEGLHLDSWLELDVVDGFRVSLAETPQAGREKLFFVNLGAYRDDLFTELHEFGFFVATTPAEAKTRAKASLFRQKAKTVHKDDLHEVDDCIALGRVNGLHIVLTKTGETSVQKPRNAYVPIPKDEIAQFKAR